jgi:hypothetical protein
MWQPAPCPSRVAADFMPDERLVLLEPAGRRKGARCQSFNLQWGAGGIAGTTGGYSYWGGTSANRSGRCGVGLASRLSLP